MLWFRIGSNPHNFSGSASESASAFRACGSGSSRSGSVSTQSTCIFEFFMKIVKIQYAVQNTWDHDTLPLTRRGTHCKLALLRIKVKKLPYFPICLNLAYVWSTCGLALFLCQSGSGSASKRSRSTTLNKTYQSDNKLSKQLTKSMVFL